MDYSKYIKINRTFASKFNFYILISLIPLYNYFVSIHRHKSFDFLLFNCKHFSIFSSHIQNRTKKPM